MSDTPRTDAWAVKWDEVKSDTWYVPRIHARTFEQELNEARNQIPCKIREHFCACPNCDPVMCCNGQECGCQGLPVDFTPTEKCDGYCLNKTHRDLQATKAERDQWKQCAQNLFIVARLWGATFQKYHSWKANSVPVVDYPDAVIADYLKVSELEKDCLATFNQLSKTL